MMHAPSNRKRPEDRPRQGLSFSRRVVFMSCCSHGLVKPKPKPRPPKSIPIQFGFLEPQKGALFDFSCWFVVCDNGRMEGREEGLPRGHRTDPDSSQSGKKRRIVMKGNMGTSHRQGAGLGLGMGC